MGPTRLACAMAAVLAHALGGAACGRDGIFECADDDQCTLGGVEGRCEPSGYCSLPDGDCPDGFRYVDQAPGGLAGRCVGESDCVGPDCSDGGAQPGTGCAVAVAAGARHTCAINDAGDVYCWGDNASLQLGSSGGSTAQPRQVVGVTGAQALAAGDEHTCALLADGELVCWGENDSGQLGTGDTGPASLAGPTVQELSSVFALAAGSRHTCAIGDTQTAWCWGDNSIDQVLTGKPDAVATPVEIFDLLAYADAYAVAAGGLHSAEALDDDSIQTWGQDGAPALGRGDSALALPGKIGTGSFAAAQLTAGSAHTCGVGTDGRVRCWGVGGDGQLGVAGDRDTPAEVPDLAGVDDVRAGARHTCALSGTTLRCWGANDDGQLGVDASSGPEPRQLAGTWRAVAPGGSHTCARTTSDDIYCWGANGDSQLGRTGDSSRDPSAVELPCR